MHTFTTSPDYEHYWIGFDGEEIDALFRSLGLEYNSHQVFCVENFDFAKTLFTETRKRMDNEKTEKGRALVLSTLLSVLGLLRTGTETKTPKKINYAEKAATLIKNNYMYQLRMSDVARELHLTEKYLYRLFMDRFGISLQQFLIKTRMEKAYELLKIFDMQDYARVDAGNLPYGAQRRLEILRALATNPKVLLLDEPAAGMNPSETSELMDNIRKIRDDFQIAIVLIVHDMTLVMGLCEGIAVLNFGRIIAKGTPDDIKNNDKVIEAYLGRKEED